MHKAPRARILCGIALFTLLAGAVRAAPQTDATKKGSPAGLLPEGSKLAAEQLARHIDKVIEQKLKAEKVTLSPATDDAEFLRRVSLDLAGKIPTAEKTVAFLDSKEPNKRSKLIDELLAGKDYGKHMADIWQALLMPPGAVNFRYNQYYPNVVKWLEEQFNANAGWDKITRGVLTASGPVDKVGPVAYYLANPTADKMTDNATRMFLGVQLQCAQCHNHPFTDWKQSEYWEMAAFFTRVRPEGNPATAARNGETITISERNASRGRRGGLPASAKILPPRFLGGERPTVKSGEPVRPLLADWVVSAKNPYFARAMVNRTWGQLFGRGFVNPVDDMHEGNAASHPQLLADLAGQFAGNGFDVKYLIRAVCNSKTYQRSSKPSGNNSEAGPELFARMAIKPLTPSQTYDSLTLLMGSGGDSGRRRRGPAGGRFGVSSRQAFVRFFGIEDGADPTEYQAGIPQVLRLMNSPQFNRSTLATSLGGKSKAETTEKLYLAVLSRRPTGEEVNRIDAFLQRSASEREGFAGVLWALVNSSEFALNR